MDSISGYFTYVPMLFIIIVGLMVAASAVRVLPEYERGVLFRLGRYAGTRGPGLFFIIPGVDKLIRVSLRTVVMDVPPQDVITHDNVTVKVSAVIYFRVIEPEKAIIDVENFLYATSQLSQTTLRSVLGQVELDELLANREKINRELQEILDRHAGPWGVKVSNVEVKNIDLPQEMMRAIAKQAEAERERRAKIIHAEGELQASEKLAKAAAVLAQEPMSLQLRFLQTLTEIGAERTQQSSFPFRLISSKCFWIKSDYFVQGIEERWILFQTGISKSHWPIKTGATGSPVRPFFHAWQISGFYYFNFALFTQFIN